MKKHRFLTVLLAMMLVLIGYGMAGVAQIGNTLQYLFIAPEEAPIPDPLPEKLPKTQAKTYLDKLTETAEEWRNIISAYTLTGIAEGTAFSAKDGASTQGRLWAVSPGDNDLYHRTLLFGRNFYPEELSKGRRICLIDDEVAIALFRAGDAVGRKVLIAGQEYEVMGVLRHQKRVGDHEDHGVYIPLLSAADDRIPLSYYMVSAKPIKGSGARETFKASMAAYAPSGSMWDLNRESVGATLPVRVFLFIAGLTGVVLLVKFLNQRVMRFIEDYKARLLRQYAVRLLPRLIGFILLFAVGYGIASGAFALLVAYIVEPVYIFPEWIPDVLVEWKDIHSAFWKVWQQGAQTMELRSPEVMRVRFFATLLQWMCALCACLLPVMTVLAFKNRKKKER